MIPHALLVLYVLYERYTGLIDQTTTKKIGVIMAIVKKVNVHDSLTEINFFSKNVRKLSEITPPDN